MVLTRLGAAALAALVGCRDEALPQGPLVVDAYDADRAESGWILGAVDGVGGQIFVIDRAGGLAWSQPLDLGVTALSAELVGDDVVFDRMVRQGGAEGELVRQPYAGGEPRITAAPGLHHSFAALPEGGLAWLATDAREAEPWGPVVGDAVQVTDRGGDTRALVSLWDVLPVTENAFFGDRFYPDGADWTHTNTLVYDAPSGDFLLTVRNLAQVLVLDGASGALKRTFGPAVVGAPDLYAPHGARWLDPHTLLLVTSDPDAGETWAAELAVSADGTLTEQWSYGRGEGIFSDAKGEARRLPNGDTLVNFGSAGVAREVTAAGEVVWEAHATGLLGTTQVIAQLPDR